MLRLVWGQPLRGVLVNVDIYRRTISPTSGLPGDWVLLAAGIDGNMYEDRAVEEGTGYQYLVLPAVRPEGADLPVMAQVMESNVAEPSMDPYPPSGTILINNGDEVTTSRIVTLNLTVDDSFSGPEGGLGSDQTVPGSPPDQIEMRISNTPDFANAVWMPFEPVVEGWDLGELSPGDVSTVYVQFKDADENISLSGFGQVDSIIYQLNMVALPIILK